MKFFIRRYRLLTLAALIIVVNGTIIYTLPRYRFDSIVLHHSASWTDNYESIRAYHRTRWPIQDAAYHLILSNGSTDVPKGYIEPTGRYRWLSYSIATLNPRYNLSAVHVCVVGNYHERPVTKNMQAIIGHTLRTLMDKYNIPRDKILFHRDLGSTVCPGRYITKPFLQEWIAAADHAPESIKAQQTAVINHARYSLWTFPRTVLAAMAVMSLLFAAVWMILTKILMAKTKKAPEIFLEPYEEPI
ncbi:N-acetylmuramoyl-L-alanine amidase [Thermodesulfobacteriota bacterium]